jgi:hypothetical protein
MDGAVSEIVGALAAIEGCDPAELDYALQDHVDVGAIKSLTAHRSDSWTLSFEVPGHSVTVTGDGVVLVDGESVETELQAS